MASGAGGVGGGGGGGGKIRARRCHQGPVKPYQQGRQQHQVRDRDAAGAGRGGNACGAPAPHVEAWEGPVKGRRGAGARASGWRREAGPSLRHTRVARAASPRGLGQGLTRTGAGREQKLWARGARVSFVFGGDGGSRTLLTSSGGRKEEVQREASALAVS